MSRYNRYADALWGNRRAADTDRLNPLLPSEGEVPFNPDKLALEMYRQYANAYHDIYNNGAGNWNMRGWMLNNVSRFYGMPVGAVRDILKDIRWRGHSERLERLGDRVIDEALKEQFGIVA